MQMRHGTQDGLRVMHGDGLAERRTERRNALELGEARRFHDVRLNDVHLAAQDEVAVFVMGVDHFAGRYGDGQGVGDGRKPV